MPKPLPELRTSVVPLEVHRVTNLNSLKEGAEKHWNVRRIQPLFPPMEQLFKLESIRTPYQYGLKTKAGIQTISNPDAVYVNGTEVPVHRKTTMILPSYRVMRGDFGTAGLPCEKEFADEFHQRIQSPHTAAYVGALASSVLSESGCIHFPEVYGTFTGMAGTHVIDISDDYDDLAERPWFLPNLGHFFELKLKPSQVPTTQPTLTLGEETVELTVDELAPITSIPPSPHLGPAPIEELEDDLEEDDDEEDSDSVSTGYVFAVRTCSSDGSGHEDGQGFEDDECEPFAEAVFHDVPVQITVMQKCLGTLYQLFKENTEPEKRIAWLAQVVFGLAYAQRNYGFVHNDLHVNNVMYVPTEKEFLYYTVAGKVYRVPTFGYVMKIIDFDRATFSVRLSGMREPRFFMSDQFNVSDEAGGQYNVEPFYISKYPQVKPNPSFDLVRLATSLFWDCYPEGPLHEAYVADPLFRILMGWMRLPDGTSILFRNLAEGDTHERYVSFHLYKAIARYCKGTAVPRQQIDLLGGPYLFQGRPPQGETPLSIE
jgi:hypothetical protein